MRNLVGWGFGQLWLMINFCTRKFSTVHDKTIKVQWLKKEEKNSSKVVKSVDSGYKLPFNKEIFDRCRKVGN